MYVPETRDVTLREMIEAMKKSPDDAVFRWFQDSYPSSDGSIHPGVTMRITVGQIRRELGLATVTDGHR